MNFPEFCTVFNHTLIHPSIRKCHSDVSCLHLSPSSFERILLLFYATSVPMVTAHTPLATIVNALAPVPKRSHCVTNYKHGVVSTGFPVEHRIGVNYVSDSMIGGLSAMIPCRRATTATKMMEVTGNATVSMAVGNIVAARNNNIHTIPTRPTHTATIPIVTTPTLTTRTATIPTRTHHTCTRTRQPMPRHECQLRCRHPCHPPMPRHSYQHRCRHPRLHPSPP